MHSYDEAVRNKAIGTALAAIAMVALSASLAIAAAASGKLKLEVLGKLGAGAQQKAEIYAQSGKNPIATVRPGDSVSLKPGTYRMVLPIVGGRIVKNNVVVVAGRTHTVLIQNVAVMQVSVKDSAGKDPGLGVAVTQTDPPHHEVARFLTGEKMLFAPAQVDVKVDAPPQGYYWHAVTLMPGQRARLTLHEMHPAELVIQPMLFNAIADKATRVIVYRAGTQKQVAASPPGPHRFELDPGDYDVYVQNDSGKGIPYVTLKGINLKSGAKVERKVPLDKHK